MGTMVEGAAARKVIIIGAGFAGLAAARRVASKGADRWQATILEASNRVGGRAHTVEVRGTQCSHAVVRMHTYALAFIGVLTLHGLITAARIRQR
jgi:phytoene dehydrogenase-like protein